ncbi:MAG: phenylacetate--CoA ligase [Thermodesulfobacteriota bacterium]
MSKFWDQRNECLDREEIRQVQLERLQATLHRVYKNVRHYHQTFRGIDFMPDDLTGLDDLKKLPFTTRDILRENYPYDMFAVPLREVVRLHAPALTMDKPQVVGFTKNDLKNWGMLMARGLSAVGVNNEDVVQVALVPGKLIGPFGFQLGTEQIGASAIPMSVGRMASQARIMRDFRATAFVSTPSFALRLIDAMEKQNIRVMDLSLKHGLFGSEPWSESTRETLESALRITATDIYGLKEVFGPGLAWECPAKNGLHLFEDHFIPEIIDPQTLQPLPPGSEGELVITTLTKEAYPLIRFRTGDLTRLDFQPCACGRTHCRLARIFKRCDGTIVMRGGSIVPDQIGALLASEGGHMPAYQLLVENRHGQDQLTVLIQISDKTFFDEMGRQREYVEKLHQAVSEFLGWDVTIRMVERTAFDPAEKVRDLRRL